MQHYARVTVSCTGEQGKESVLSVLTWGAHGSASMLGLTYILQTAALVVLQQAMLATEVTTAETTVAKDALNRLSAVLGAATDLLAGHDAWRSCIVGAVSLSVG